MRKAIIFGILILGSLGILNGCSDKHEEGPMVEYMMSIGCEYEDTLVLDLANRYDEEILIYDADELSWKLLENRENKVIVERVFGIVKNANGDGEILNPFIETQNYISYRRCGEIPEGTLMVSYMVYNPDSSYTDDILERYDCVIPEELYPEELL